MKSFKNHYWVKPQPVSPSGDVIRQAKKFRTSTKIIYLLHNRGLKNDEAIRQYLYPTLKDLVSPFEMKGVRTAARVITETLQDDGELIIWGDYDVDGVTATSLLILFFGHYTEKIRWFIPNRFRHGYGLNEQELRKLISSGTSDKKVLITVDCGIQNHQEIEVAQKMGCKVIVTDHHEPGEVEVTADAVINPKMNDCGFPDRDIAGVGLAFYLAMGVRASVPQDGPNLKQFLDLVAVGTIADMVPLRGSNRVLVKAGFEVLNSSPNPGLAALMKECDIFSGNITSEDISFQIAPRINAAGRMADAAVAVEMLISNDLNVCNRIATQLSKLNTDRKNECTKCLEFTLALTADYNLEKKKCFIAIVPYSMGILGVVASQVMEKLRMPVILLTDMSENGLGKVLRGSCRSVEGINLYQILEKCADLLLQFGGHAMAAGITIQQEKIDLFERLFSNILAEENEMVGEKKKIDLLISIEEAVSTETINELYLLEPYGNGNHKPLFFDQDVSVQEIKRMGRNGDHLSFVKRGTFENKRCVAFNFGDFENDFKNNPYFDLIYTVAISRFRKMEKWQPHLVDCICKQSEG